jgi:hypothetical protein
MDVAKGKHPLTKRRSRHWKVVRRDYIKHNPACAVCGSRKKLEIHHKQPFYLFPEKELNYNNLITLCHRHHYTFGHLCNYRSYNDEVEYDAIVFRKKIKDRP